jgi:hypothetical protein
VLFDPTHVHGTVILTRLGTVCYTARVPEASTWLPHMQATTVVCLLGWPCTLCSQAPVRWCSKASPEAVQGPQYRATVAGKDPPSGAHPGHRQLQLPGAHKLGIWRQRMMPAAIPSRVLGLIVEQLHLRFLCSKLMCWQPV